MSRADEIAQGLRDQYGGLIGGLNVFECSLAQEDFEAGRPPPRITTASYDIWRARISREAAERAEIVARIKADSDVSRARIRAIIIEADRPDILAEYDARMDAIDRGERPR